MKPKALTMYVVYDHPTDYPEHWVVRPLVIDTRGVCPGPVVGVSPDLAPLRERLRALGLTCLPRQRGDDPVIVETWL